MSARDEVLARVRRALTDRPPSPAIARQYRTAGFLEPSADLLAERLEDYGARVHRTTDEQVAAVVGGLLPGPAVVPAGFPEPWQLAVRYPLRDSPPLAVRALDTADSALTTCACAIAETGTIVLDGGPGQGRRALTLVPDHHVVVVRAGDVVAHVPDALRRLDARRPQTWISGPSATSDIELERVEGVHGPRRLDVVLLR